MVVIGTQRIRQLSWLTVRDIKHEKDKGNERKNEFEKLFVNNNALAAKFTASDWVKEEPYQPYARWFLAKAHSQLGMKV